MLFAVPIQLISKVTMNAVWRNDPLLKDRFHPDYPDDLQVLVHDGDLRLSGKQYEMMWVSITGKQGIAYVGRLLNQPQNLTSVKQNDEIIFSISEAYEYPFRVTDQYLSERKDWWIMPCDECGFSDLFNAPSEVIAHKFPNVSQAKNTQMFTSFCPICTGVQVVLRKEAYDEMGNPRINSEQEKGSSETRQEMHKWWQFWKQ